MTAYSLRGTAGLPPVPGMQRVGKVITMETAPEKIVMINRIATPLLSTHHSRPHALKSSIKQGDHVMSTRHGPALPLMHQRLPSLESKNPYWSWRGIFLLAIAMPMLIPLLHTYASATMNLEKLSPYTGPPLTLDTLTFLCSSNHVASGGYWGAAEDVEQGGWIKAEPATSKWRITLNPEKASAEVLRLSGLSKPPEESETYTLEVTSSNGFLLVWKERLRGFAPQVITIDPTNSSFVYSTQHTNAFRNRGSVFWGTCVPYL